MIQISTLIFMCNLVDTEDNVIILKWGNYEYIIDCRSRQGKVSKGPWDLRKNNHT